VKNLSPSQISLSTLKGEGELLNLELNEVSYSFVNVQFISMQK
jgi:hypothetical protein